MSTFQSDAFVFFGATGDLAYKQIFPALQGLIRDEGFDMPVIGVAKAGWNLDQLKARAKDSLEKHGGVDQAAFEKLLTLLRYVDGDYQDKNTFTELKKQMGGAQRPLHYLAIPPVLFSVVAAGIAESGCGKNAKIVVEKPFGHDLASALALNETLHKYFSEDAIFRIDHYLGKEPVQNILYTRFANPMFEPVWNRNYVKCIQITMAEAFGVDDRGSFYDATGALRDVVQNHMLQVLSNLAMDAPATQDHEGSRDAKAALLKAVRPISPENVVRGQYNGYRSVKGVAPDSNTETFLAVKLFIDTWRWAGVPIYIRAGKKLPVTSTEIFVEYKRPPLETYSEIVPASSAHMRFEISPNITIAVGVRVKIPGDRMVGRDTEMILKEEAADDMPPYERLFGDALRGHMELFAREDLVEAQWRAVQPILDANTPLYGYAANSWGPEEATTLIGGDGPWVNPVDGEPKNN